MNNFWLTSLGINDLKSALYEELETALISLTALVENIHNFLDYNKDVDLFFVPRINTVNGLTSDHIKKWSVFTVESI